MKNYFLVLLFSFMLIPGFSQNKEAHDQIKSLKIAHISSALNLTNEEAEKFWPIYNTYDNKISTLRHNSIFKYIKQTDATDIAKLSDKEANLKLQELIDDEEDYFKTRQKFIIDAKKIISSKKIILLKKAEDDFNRKLLKKYKDNK